MSVRMMMGPPIYLHQDNPHSGAHEEIPGGWCLEIPVCTPVDPNHVEEAVPEFTPQAGPDAAPRASALNEARDLITGDRNNQYGPPTQDFKRTADILNAMGYGRTDAEDVIQPILASDVALIIAQVKVSRLMHSRDKRDSWVDLAGYAACGYECAVEEAKDGE